MTREELNIALKDPQSLFKMYDKIKDLGNSKEIDWDSKSKNPTATKRFVYNIFLNAFKSLIDKENERIANGYRFCSLTVGESLTIKNCYNEFGKYIKW